MSAARDAPAHRSLANQAARAEPGLGLPARHLRYDAMKKSLLPAVCRPRNLTCKLPMDDPEIMRASAEKASRLLKAMSNQDRLMILCILAESEKCVSDLEDILGIRQPTLSQQLARLRSDGLVVTRRDGKVIHYKLASNEAGRVIELLFELYCAPALAASRKSQVA